MPAQFVPIVSWLILVAAAILLSLAAWIVVPGWTYPLLVLSAGAPEVSPWLIVGGLLVCVLTVTVLGSTRVSHSAFAIALLSTVLASIPLTRAPFAIRRFDGEMQRALGKDFLAGVAPSALGGLRKRPIAIVDLFKGVDFGNAGITHDIPFASPAGQRLAMTIYRPDGAGPFPTVVQVYGGAWQRGSPGDDPELARYLAARGYLVAAIDYRHVPQWPWPAAMIDVRSALDWIRSHAAEYSADVSRLVLMGRSAGAHLAMIAAYEPGAPNVRGVISFYGPVDLADAYRNPPRPDPADIRAIDEAFLAGTPDSAPDRYRDASPISYVTRPLPPTLLVYGGRDHVVEARRGRRLHERLRAMGTTSVLLEIPWAEHAFDAVPSGPSAQIALYYTERFLAWAMSR